MEIQLTTTALLEHRTQPCLCPIQSAAIWWGGVLIIR